MTILKFLTEFLKFLFTKIGDSESIQNFFEQINKIPSFLKKMLGFVLIIGIFYFGLSKWNKSEIRLLQTEVQDLKTVIATTVSEEDYTDDIYYLMDAIEMCEQVTYYAYQEEQLQLQLIKKYMSRHNPNDPIIVDIDAMIDRNDIYYKQYSGQFKQALSKCKKRKPNKEEKNKFR